jgi:hypothetical protein
MSLELRGEVVRNATDEIRVMSGEFWKVEVVDIRWYNSDKPSKKGIRLNIAEARQVHAILGMILEEM